MEKNTESVLVLEPSTNTHSIQGNVKVVTETPELGGMVLKIAGPGIVSHGEHGTIVTESENVIKLVQQEFNPVLRTLQNAYD